ncbi:hypothetical protein CYXG_00171 [Synechococcus phage S-SSM4]|jgi:hypothetical protein|uniref:Uncharacterized protein n=1 Tax=Synechococcus phage S-SSM4 TaxID=536466 RepID=M1T2F1_9CAUD|nr:hypothetical protein CYXG_00171 [Synechococcus phage S-SSM4]AGG54235.1 hypothetical protein CYXG_00171 [Synechococcus phage S-SSM4]AGG54407.1 hypothetical protein CYWG_00123 [Cyanophage S-SSM6b]
MRVDRHHDPVTDLENSIIHELEGITTQLGGTMSRLTRVNSMGRSCKVIEIEYDVEG